MARESTKRIKTMKEISSEISDIVNKYIKVDFITIYIFLPA